MILIHIDSIEIADKNARQGQEWYMSSFDSSH